MSNTEFYSVVPSPVGELTLVSNGGALTGLYLADARHARVAESTWVRDDARLSAAARQLAEYFAGKRTHFDLPLAAVGTPFQREVWQALRAIPYGATLSYAELATRVGSPRAVRAVGAANGRNPISIVVPCHRVVGSDGSLTGYAGGLARKQWLLALEARTPADLLRVPPEVGARTSGFIHDSDTAPRGTHDETPSHRSHRPENPSLASRDLL